MGLRSIDGFFDGAKFSESPRGGGGRHCQMWVVRGVGDHFWLQQKFSARGARNKKNEVNFFSISPFLFTCIFLHSLSLFFFVNFYLLYLTGGNFFKRSDWRRGSVTFVARGRLALVMTGGGEEGDGVVGVNGGSASEFSCKLGREER